MKFDKVKQNYKIVRTVHMIVIAGCVLALLFWENDLSGFFLTLLLIVSISLILQMLVFYIKPGLFSDKIKLHPDED